MGVFSCPLQQISAPFGRLSRLLVKVSLVCESKAGFSTSQPKGLAGMCWSKQKTQVHTVFWQKFVICELETKESHLHNLDIDFVVNMKKIGGNNMYLEHMCPLFADFEPFKRRPKFQSKQPGHQRVPGIRCIYIYIYIIINILISFLYFQPSSRLPKFFTKISFFGVKNQPHLKTNHLFTLRLFKKSIRTHHSQQPQKNTALSC